jgi:Concanavalin A-like lectin/glucanases superfamily/Bacterial Ig-like domain
MIKLKKPCIMSSVTTLSLLIGAAFTFVASAQVVFNTAGAINYSYSASGGSATLPAASDGTFTNITIANYTLFGPGSPNVTGLTNVTGGAGSAIFHFQTGPGIAFSNDVNLTAGSGRSSSGSIVASYSFDNINWVQWGSNVSAADQTFNVTNVANGQTNLYVQFVFSGTNQGDTVLTWGGSPNERNFTLSGSTAAAQTAPLLSNFSPLNNAIAVPITTNPSAVFSEPVFRGTGNIELWKAGGVSPVELFIAATSPRLTFSRNTVTIDPTSNLDLTTEYYILIGATAIKDASSENFAGLTEPGDWRFTTQDPPHPAGLIGWWDFNLGNAENNVGGIKDLATSGGNHDATLSGTGGVFSTDVATPLAGLGSQSLDLTGGGYAVVDTFTGGAFNSHFNTGAALSVSFWLKGWPTNTDPWQPFVVKGGESAGWQVRRLAFDIQPTFTLRGTNPGDEFIGGALGPNADWTHIVAYYNGTERGLYVNGVFVGSTATTGAIASAADLVSFGAKPDGGQLSNVKLDDIGIWNTALTLPEVASLYAGVSPAGGGSYASWISNPAFGIAPDQQGLTDDPDGDGVQNGLENLLGTHPGQFSQGLVPGTSNGSTFTFTHTQNTTPANDLTSSYVWSKDLMTFRPSGASDGGTTVTITSQANTPTAGITTVTVTASAPTARIFVRLAANQVARN